MRKLYLISFVLIILVGITCNAQTKLNPATAVSKNGDIEVYYFHMTVRCTTCKTVEAEARKNVEMLYADQVKAGKISFTALNLEEATGKTLGDKLGVPIYLAAVIVFGGRLFDNFAIIRRLLLEKAKSRG